MKTIVAGILVALASTASWGQWAEPDGRPLPDESFRKSVDGLGAMLIVVTNYTEFINGWASKDRKNAPQLATAWQVKRGGEATILIFFANCAKAGEKCMLSADITVVAPNGSVYGQFKDRKAFDGPVGKEGEVTLSKAMIQMKVEPKDALGDYKVLATLRRPSTKTSIDLELPLRVIQ